MICRTRAELPEEYECRKCGDTKPIAEMVLVHRRKTHDYLLRPRCKQCHNDRERGHRRAYKTKYLRRWRRDNAEINESYWRQAQAANRATVTARARVRFWQNHGGILIQSRLRRKGIKVSLAEANRRYRKFGICYPTRFGLTARAERECERIRSAERKLPKHHRHLNVEIRMMMYEDGHFKRPSRQKPPYQVAARRLSAWQRAQGHGLELVAA